MIFEYVIVIRNIYDPIIDLIKEYIKQSHKVLGKYICCMIIGNISQMFGDND